MNFLEKKMDFLLVKLSSLSDQLSVSRQILNEAGIEINKIFSERRQEELKNVEDPAGNQLSSNHFPPPEQPIDNNQDLIRDPEVKSLFKKIALKTHPDKLPKKITEYEKKEKKELFHAALTAAEESDYITLIKIAKELGISTPQITQKMIEDAENKIISIKEEINRIESTFVWKWIFSNNQEEKKLILDKLYKILHGKK